jgi:hypothetical protein
VNGYLCNDGAAIVRGRTAFYRHIMSRAAFDAFATVPWESFVGPGTWRTKSPMRIWEYRTTPDANPRHVYHDALIALDETRGITTDSLAYGRNSSTS